MAWVDIYIQAAQRPSNITTIFPCEKLGELAHLKGTAVDMFAM